VLIPVSRYHGVTNNPYPFPNDDVEKGRLDELHYVLKEVFNGNILVPLRKKPIPTQIGPPPPILSEHADM
jgi:hypothetical protein